MIHLCLHFLIPAIVAALFFQRKWLSSYALMVLTMLVDLDHLMADPIYDPGRCSIGFHPLHGMLPITLYGCLCLIPKCRLIGIGLLIHMALDSIDCQFTNGVWCACT